MRCREPCLMAFFLAPPLKVRLRGGAGRAAHCASRRTRTRRAMGLVRRRRRARSCPPEELRQFVRQAPVSSSVGDRTPCGLRRLNPRERRATARGEGCEGLDGSAPPRPLEAPSLVVHSARAAPRQTPALTHTHPQRRPGELVKKPSQRRGPDRPPVLWVSPVMRLGTSKQKSASGRPFNSSTRTGRAASSRRRSLLL